MVLENYNLKLLLQISMKLPRRSFVKGLMTVPFVDYFAFGFKCNITK